MKITAKEQVELKKNDSGERCHNRYMNSILIYFTAFTKKLLTIITR